MNDNKTNVVGGISFLDLLQVAFIILKLCGVIKWSWWLVLLPLWIELGVLGILLIVLIILVLHD